MSETTHVRIDQDTKNKMADYCKDTGRIQSWVVSKAVEKYLEEKYDK